MLTQQEILKEIFTLPPSEQREIVEKIENHIEQNNGKENQQLSVDEKMEIVQSLAGSLKMENPPMTKEEVRERIYEHLSEKYK